jgi:8-oxo-dGTP diphosphatase
MEPEKCEGWEWKTWAELQAIKGDSEPGTVMFLPLHTLLEKKQSVAELKSTNLG